MKKKVTTYIFALFLILSAARMYFLNSSNRYLITDYEVNLNEEMDMDAVTYTILKIEKEVIYNKDYRTDVIRYNIDFTAKNNTNDIRDVLIYEKIALISGGTSWWIDPIDNLQYFKENDVSLTLNPNETTKGRVWVEAIPDKENEGFYTKDILHDSTIFYIEKFDKGAYKYHLLNK